MSFKVFESAGEGAYFTTLLAGGLLSIIAVALRLVAVRHSRRKPAAEDWFALAAVVILVSRCVIGMTGINYGLQFDAGGLANAGVIELSIVNGRGALMMFDKAAYASAFKACLRLSHLVFLMSGRV